MWLTAKWGMFCCWIEQPSHSEGEEIHRLWVGNSSATSPVTLTVSAKVACDISLERWYPDREEEVWPEEEWDGKLSEISDFGWHFFATRISVRSGQLRRRYWPGPGATAPLWGNFHQVHPSKYELPAIIIRFITKLPELELVFRDIVLVLEK